MTTKSKVLAWGKPTIQVCALRPDGQPDGRWMTFPQAVEDSTQLTPTKGEKYEAKVEGGQAEAVRYSANTYELTFEIRRGQGDTPTIEDQDGVIDGIFALRLKPENPKMEGLRIDACALSAELSYSSKDGYKVKYTANVLKAPAGKSVKVEAIDLSATNSLIVTIVGAGGAGAWRLSGEPNWRESGEATFVSDTGNKTIEYRPVASKTAPRETTANIKAGENALVATYTG